MRGISKLWVPYLREQNNFHFSNIVCMYVLGHIAFRCPPNRCLLYATVIPIYIAYFQHVHVLFSVNGELKLVTIGKQPTSEGGNFSYLFPESHLTVWHRTGVPQDGTPISITHSPLLSLMVLMYTYATGGILFAIICLIFNIVFRKKTLVDNFINFVGGVCGLHDNSTSHARIFHFIITNALV